MTIRMKSVFIVFFMLALPVVIQAQWSSDPTENLAIASKVDEQVQPKVKTLADGSCYVSWFDTTGSPAYGYDMFLQRLNASGVAQWDADGIRIADRNYTWTMDYGLDVDAAGNALLAFRDDRSGSDQITATKVSPAGVQLWGDNGVQVSSGTEGKLSPAIAATSDGGAAVAWGGTVKKGPAIFIMKLNANGEEVWDTTITAPKHYTYDFSHLVASDDGSVIVSWVKTNLRGFNRYRHLLAQKFSARGKFMWGPKGIVVFDDGTLQDGEFPIHLSDGSGGAVFGWWTKSFPYECYAQHVTASGDEAFGHNGVAAAVSVADRSEPSITYDPSTGNIFLFYRESLSQESVYGQKFSPTGARQWTDNGLEIRPLGDVSISWVTSVNTSSGIMVFWIDELAYRDQKIYGVKLDANGGFICSTFDLSTLSASKNRISADVTPAGMTILAWEDGRNDANDVYGQNVNADCSLGNAP